MPGCREHCLGRCRRRVGGFHRKWCNRTIRHVAHDEFNRRHATDLFGIGLPQRAVKRPAGLPFPDPDGLGDLDLLKLGDGQPPVINKYRHARVGIHHTAQVWARARYAIGMPPEIAELCSLTTHDEQ